MTHEVSLTKQIAELSNEVATVREDKARLEKELTKARANVKADAITRSNLILFLAAMTGAMFGAVIWRGNELNSDTMNLITILAQGVKDVLVVGVGFYFGRESRIEQQPRDEYDEA